MPNGVARLAVLTAAVVLPVLASSASPAWAVRPAGPVVEHTDPVDDPGACFFEPGDVPGLTTYVEATCTFVHVPAGGLQVVAHATLPQDAVPARTFVGELASCFGGTGRVVATTSGVVQATCRLP